MPSRGWCRLFRSWRCFYEQTDQARLCRAYTGWRRWRRGIRPTGHPRDHGGIGARRSRRARPPGGTLPEEEPFRGPLRFTRKDVTPKSPAVCGRRSPPLAEPVSDAQQANEAVLRRIPAERLIHTFRLNAGISSTAQPLGGWEKPDCEIRGCFAGHFLTASAHMYASTGDEDVKAKGDSIVAGLAECQARLRGGYLSAFPTRALRPPQGAPRSLGAVLHDSQDHGGTARHVPDLRQQAGSGNRRAAWPAGPTPGQRPCRRSTCRPFSTPNTAA